MIIKSTADFINDYSVNRQRAAEAEAVMNRVVSAISKNHIEMVNQMRSDEPDMILWKMQLQMQIEYVNRLQTAFTDFKTRLDAMKQSEPDPDSEGRIPTTQFNFFFQI